MRRVVSPFLLGLLFAGLGMALSPPTIHAGPVQAVGLGGQGIAMGVQSLRHPPTMQPCSTTLRALPLPKGQRWVWALSTEARTSVSTVSHRMWIRYVRSNEYHQ